MRIAMVAACPFPSVRGSQVLIANLAHDLGELGHEVHLVTYSPIEAGGLKTAGGLVRIWARIRSDIELGIRLYRVVRDEGIEVIHAHNYEAPVCAYVTRWITGVPVVYHSHNALSDELETYVDGGPAKAFARRVGRLLDRQVPRRADFTIALTNELRDFLLSCGVQGSRMAVFSPGADPGVGVAARDARPDGSDFIVGYAGNLDPYQDLDVLLRGFVHFRRKVQNAILMVITHEYEWRRRGGWLLEELVARGFARVSVLPTFSGVARGLEHADVLACPRSSWSGYPIKLLNYMTAGRPIVAASGSAKGLVDGETGLIFADGDARHLARQLSRLHADRELRNRLGAAVRIAVCENHDRKKIAYEIARIHARLCSRRANRTLSGCGQGSPWRRLMALLGRRIGAFSSARTTK
jgi:glycosyltransferase involved in cell wall biosynthesis